jgi:hypothetical protein
MGDDGRSGESIAIGYPKRSARSTIRPLLPGHCRTLDRISDCMELAGAPAE